LNSTPVTRCAAATSWVTDGTASVNQAAWSVEKIRKWSDCDGHPATVFTRDELLDNVMLYGLPEAGAFSARLYW